MPSRISKHGWRSIAIGFVVIISILLIIAVAVATSRKPKTDAQSQSMIEWYHELQPSEIIKVLKYLEKKTPISLVLAQNARLNASFVHYIELKPPSKETVLKHINQKGPRPERFAKAAIFRGDLKTPVVEEYHLGPLHNISSFSKTRSVPYSQRPLIFIEITYVYMYIVPKFKEATKPFMKNEYNITTCTRGCIDVSFTPIPSTIATTTRRQVWIWFNLKSTYNLHPLDFQFEADLTSTDPAEWTLGRIWYDSRLFGNVNLFMIYYNKTEKGKSHWYTKKHPTWDSNNEAPKAPATDKRQATRYTLTDNFSTVTYLKWKFHLHISPTGGLRLLNVRYRGEMIVYEMNLQEIAVLYSGTSPGAQNFNFVDGTALFGSRIQGLVEGADCPPGASFISPTIYTVNDRGFAVQPRATCIFEHDPQVPLRRHKIRTASGHYYRGIPDKVLVVRVILSFLSYDYVMDYVFHNNGALESRVFSTGTLVTTMLSPAEEGFGVKIDPVTIANIHNHLFNYKVDLDILGERNRHSIWRLKSIQEKNVWSNSTSGDYTMDKLSRDLIKTENEAAYIYDFQKQGYLLFHNDTNMNKNGYPRSYRILLSGMSPKTPDDHIFTSLGWGETQLAVTQRKDDEETSSSVYALWDSIKPVVDFRKYINNESIVDEDLVAWITLGFRHIPSIENVPCTLTLGTKSSFLLMPFNYFDEDPTMNDADNIYISIE